MITFIDGDLSLFNDLKKSFENGLTKSVDNPGKNSKAYLLTSTTNSYFIKPFKDNSYQKETIAYDLAKKLGLQDFFLPVVTFALEKNDVKAYFSANAMLQDDFMAIQDLEFEKQGAMDGILQKYIDSGISHKLAVFDYLMKNKDRHRGNVLTDGRSILLIDHDQSFSDRNYWIPAYMRKSDWKEGDVLPLCKQVHELQHWFDNLSFKSEYFKQRYNEIKESVGDRLDEKINNVWSKS